jgi:sulfide:quinone oxidoreductase
VRWLEAEVTEIDPAAKSVKVSTGDSLRYDFLVVATGLRLDYRAIEGMDESLIGREGIGSIFAGPEAAAASSRAFAAYAEKGGVALFGRPATEMKCAGAPLKVTFLADYFLRRQGNRSAARIAYLAHSGVVFAVKPVNERVSAMFAERDIEIRHNQVLRAIDPGKRRAT